MGESMDLAEKIVSYEEGFRATPYYCSEFYPTVGHGFKIGTRYAPIEQYSFYLPEQVSRAWLQCILVDLEQTLAHDKETEAAFLNCNTVRRAVLISMAYQLGMAGLKGFKKMLNAVERQDWEDAANQALMSRWYKQTPARAERHADMLETGEMCGEYL